MSIMVFCKDFAVGLTRGLSIFFNERNDFAEKAHFPGFYTREHTFQNK